MTYRTVLALLAVVAALSGCSTIVDGHERALYFSARDGMKEAPVSSGVYWHMPWNSYVTYDLRWVSHSENVHIHSRDGLHMDIDVVAVVRPKANELYKLHTDCGPNWYDEVVKPALFAATRDGTSNFNHLDIATQTHEVEAAIKKALQEHLEGKHLELSEVAIQHFDLPKEVEASANKKATSNQLLAAKEVDVKIAQTEARIDQERRRGQMESVGLEERLRAEQALAQAKAEAEIEEAKRRAAKIRNDAEADAIKTRAEADATAVRARAEAEKARIAATSINLSTNYVRLKALETLAGALSQGNTKLIVTPTGKDGLPLFFSPFLNPYSNQLMGGMAAGPDDKPEAGKP